jgi:hypothetical protein
MTSGGGEETHLFIASIRGPLRSICTGGIRQLLRCPVCFLKNLFCFKSKVMLLYKKDKWCIFSGIIKPTNGYLPNEGIRSASGARYCIKQYPQPAGGVHFVSGENDYYAELTLIKEEKSYLK